MNRPTHSLAILELSPLAYQEIEAKLRKAGYDHVFDGKRIDMSGIGLELEPAKEAPEFPQTKHDSMDPEQVWKDFWFPLCTTPSGAVDMDQIKRELHDYALLINWVPKVYMHVTGGRVSYPTTWPSSVISVHDDHVTDLVDAQAKELMQVNIAEHLPVIRLLLEFLTAGFHALDNCEERPLSESLNPVAAASEYVIFHEWYDRLNTALECLEELPDNQPGYVMDAPAKARWALRELFGDSEDPAPEVSNG